MSKVTQRFQLRWLTGIWKAEGSDRFMEKKLVWVSDLLNCRWLLGHLHGDVKEPAGNTNLQLRSHPYWLSIYKHIRLPRNTAVHPIWQKKMLIPIFTLYDFFKLWKKIILSTVSLERLSHSRKIKIMHVYFSIRSYNKTFDQSPLYSNHQDSELQVKWPRMKVCKLVSAHKLQERILREETLAHSRTQRSWPLGREEGSSPRSERSNRSFRMSAGRRREALRNGSSVSSIRHHRVHPRRHLTRLFLCPLSPQLSAPCPLNKPWPRLSLPPRLPPSHVPCWWGRSRQPRAQTCDVRNGVKVRAQTMGTGGKVTLGLPLLLSNKVGILLQRHVHSW